VSTATRVTEPSVGLPIHKLRTREFATGVHKEPGESLPVVLDAPTQMVEYAGGIYIRQVVERHSNSHRAVGRPGCDSL